MGNPKEFVRVDMLSPIDTQNDPIKWKTKTPLIGSFCVSDNLLHSNRNV